MPATVPYLDANGNKQTMPTQDYIQAELEKEMATRDELALQLADESDQGIIPQFRRALKDIAVPTKVTEPEGEVSRKSGVNDPSTSADSAMSVKDVVFAEDVNSPNISLEKSNPAKYNGTRKKEDEQEVKGNEKREETREAFLGRASEASLEVRERGTLAFGYRRYSGQLSPNIQSAEKELKNLGIPVVVIEHMEGNKDDTTTIYSNDALSIPGVAVFIHKNATLDAMEIVGHEGYHYLMGSADRIVYREIVAENIDFSSKAIIDYQKKYVGDSYFSEDVVIGSKEWDALIEELFAYITAIFMPAIRRAKYTISFVTMMP